MSDNDDRGTRRERDMILAPNEYAFISDETKGDVSAFIGPNKTSLAGTDRCVVFDSRTKKFRPTDLASGIQTFQTAPEGWYIVLKNPAEGEKHPYGNGKQSTPNLKVGKKVNIPGPATFPLWPGQMAKVVQGHQLRSNEYLLVRVYDEEAARANWSKAVLRPVESEGEEDQKKKSDKAAVDFPSEKDLTMGKQFVIKGTNVSFYIPPTGIEVVPEKVNGEDRYVREAVTLERLEYCLLLDQNGNKRYVHGPDVVFPRPTEKFVEAPIKSSPDKVKAKKFRAQELTPSSGIHIRVISEYTEEDGTVRKAGEELFITGREQTIYSPREEHAIIKYGEQEIHYGIAIPVGEARYVLDRETGVISLVKGPQIFLPDPRKQVIAQRALDLKLCELMFPGNTDALEINAARLGVDDQDISVGGGGEHVLSANSTSETRGYDSYGPSGAVVTPDTTRRVMIKGASKALPGDAFDRKNKFTAPRSVVLNTKYDGAVSVTLWTGYAMLLIRKNGDRRVVQGPGTFLLEYDESPQVITLSRGKPKTMEKPLRTVYLLTTANKVSDIVEVETKDFCRLNVRVSYRVNFDGDSAKWFAVDNYVKFLCDNMRSRIRNAVQKMGVEEFYGNHTEILRDIVLGQKTSDEKPRPGQLFSENGMRIYDLEVLGVQMQNPEIEKMLVQSQRDVIQNTLTLATERRKLAYIKESEEIKRQVAETNAETQRQKLALELENAKHKLELDLALIAANAKTEAENAAKELAAQQAKTRVVQVETDRFVEKRQKEIEVDERVQELKLDMVRQEVQAVVDKAKAIEPGLIEALNAFGERAMVEKVAQAMAPLSIIGGESVIDVLKKLLEGTNLAKQLGPALESANANGNSKSTARHA